MKFKNIKNELESQKLYTSKRIIELTDLRTFQDAFASGTLDWVKDDTFGNKLYRLNI